MKTYVVGTHVFCGDIRKYINIFQLKKAPNLELWKMVDSKSSLHTYLSPHLA